MIELPSRTFGAFIFDCDGTLVDSMPLHYVAWCESLRRHDAPFDFTEDVFYSLAGVREQDTVTLLNKQYGTSIDPDSAYPRFKRCHPSRHSHASGTGACRCPSLRAANLRRFTPA